MRKRLDLPRNPARLETGGLHQIMEPVRRVPVGRVLQQASQDLRHATRTLLRSPAFTLSVVLVLSVAIGANTAIFSIIEGVLLRPLPYHDPERLSVLWKSVPQ